MQRKRGAPQRRGLPDGVPGGAAAPVGKGGRAEAARAGRWGPRRGGSPGGERRARRSGEGCPERSEGSARVKRRSARRGGGSARVKRRPRPPWRRGLAGAQRRVSTSQAEAAPAVAEGLHESSGGRARRVGRGANGKGRQDKPICLSSGCNKDQDYLNLRLRAASDFFLRLTEGFS